MTGNADDDITAIKLNLANQFDCLVKDGGLNNEHKRKYLLEAIKKAHDEAFIIIERTLCHDRKGNAAAVRIAGMVDAIIGVIYRYATEIAFPVANPSKAERFAIIAVGGYGRGGMAPYSDVDLLILLPYKLNPWIESVVECVLYLLWDAGFKVGYSTRTVRETIKYASQDMVVRTGLLEARFLFGDEILYKDMRHIFYKDVVRGSAKQFIAAKLNERDYRHQKTGDSRYLIEPDVKDSKGGLRDLQILFWIGKYVFQVNSRSELVGKGLFSHDELASFIASENFLWCVRCLLHFINGRNENRLTLIMQAKIAAKLGFGDSKNLTALENFNRDYFLAARNVGNLTRILCAILELKHIKATPAITINSDFASYSNEFVITNNRLDFTDDVKANIASQSLALIKLFKVAAIEGITFHPMALQFVSRNIELIDAGVRDNKVANQYFMDILTSAQSSGHVLRIMNETGILGNFIPEFKRITSLMPLSTYHYYTVDEHLIRAVSRLAEIENQAHNDDHPLASAIIKTNINRPVLYLAAFLHDIGKGSKQDHSVLGREIAIDLGPRFGLDERENELLGWLIENHLVMNKIAQSRDLSDSVTITRFAEQVKTIERLKLLLVLTVVDIASVSPIAWNGWKAQLLRILYNQTERTLRGVTKTSQQRINKAKHELSKYLTQWSEKEKRSYLERYHANYWQNIDIDSMIENAGFVLAADRNSLDFASHVAIDKNENITIITIYTRDHQFLLSVLAWACCELKANIVSAKIFTTTDNMALDAIYIERQFDADEDELSRANAIIDLIKSNLAALYTKEKRPKIKNLATLEKQINITKEARVEIYNDLSEDCTIIEVNFIDSLGLLAVLSETMSKLKINIVSAYITSYGERVVDTFYVTDLNGNKITSAERIEAIVSTLQHELTAVLAKIG